MNFITILELVTQKTLLDGSHLFSNFKNRIIVFLCINSCNFQVNIVIYHMWWSILVSMCQNQLILGYEVIFILEVGCFRVRHMGFSNILTLIFYHLLSLSYSTWNLLWNNYNDDDGIYIYIYHRGAITLNLD